MSLARSVRTTDAPRRSGKPTRTNDHRPDSNTAAQGPGDDPFPLVIGLTVRALHIPPTQHHTHHDIAPEPSPGSPTRALRAGRPRKNSPPDATPLDHHHADLL